MLESGDGDSLRARWLSGRCLLHPPRGKEAAKGVRELLENDLGLHRTEITARISRGDAEIQHPRVTSHRTCRPRRKRRPRW
jgi:hypothetical protein